jgi:16S rRNA (guanine527-N7)-methyltransferase
MTETERNLFQETLRDGTANLGISLSDDALRQCLAYTVRLLEVNTQQNLTRITEPRAVAIKHFVDSFTVLRACPDLRDGATVADVGTGAGFPGVPLKILRPDLSLTLLDSLAKRLTFLKDTLDEIDITGVTLAHARAEDAGRDPRFRDRFDLVTARAVAPLPVLLEWCGPLARVGGRFVAMKGANADDELTVAGTAAQRLGLRLTDDMGIILPPVPGDEEPSQRRLFVYEKTRPTPSPYPRRPAEIKTKPLGRE